jgi:hypothetical protein
MASAASWKFDVDFRDRTDAVTYTGDGVEDLNQLIVRLSGTFVVQPRILCDVGSLFSDWRQATIDDVYALKEKYLELNGTVNKPAWPWTEPHGNSTEIQRT